MRRWLVILSSVWVLSACQTIDRPSIQIDEEGCAALEAWAHQGASGERIVNWDWAYGPDVIGMRAKMSASGETDEFDRALYDALSRYTHSLGLGEFSWVAAECFDAEISLEADEWGGVSSVDAVADFGDVRLDLRYNEAECAFGDWVGDPGWSGCASFRARSAYSE